jgi:hypothetical protein
MESAQNVRVSAAVIHGNRIVVRCEFGCSNPSHPGPTLTDDPSPSDKQIGLLVAAVIGSLLPPHPNFNGAPRGTAMEIHEEQRNHRASSGVIWIIRRNDLGDFLPLCWKNFLQNLSHQLGESCNVINEGVGGGMHLPRSFESAV